MVKKIVVFLVIFQFIFAPVAPVLAEELNDTPAPAPVEVSPPDIAPVEIVPAEEAPPAVSSSVPSAEASDVKTDIKTEQTGPAPSYTSVMRKVAAIRSGKITADAEKQKIAAELETLIASEEDRLDNLDGGWAKEIAYADLLKKQLAFVRGEKPSFLDKAVNGIKDIFGIDSPDVALPESGFAVPKNPSSFKFNDEPIVVEKIQDIKTGNIPDKFNLSDELKKAITIEEVSAADGQMPVLADTESDGEATITSEISQLADSLGQNPVKIFNFVRNNIVYEPYFGAKKGSVGCLAEMVCNDVDTASLTIALLRASGIPAHYKKGAAIMTVEQLQKLLGVDETKTVYGALYWNKIPVHILSDLPVDTNFDNMDFTNETHLGLEWTVTEAYVEYDERGGNVVSNLNLTGIDSTDALRAVLGENQKRQWIAVDPVVKPYAHLKREVVPTTAGFDADNFWTGFLSYQGDLSPTDKYTADLLQSTGKDITNDAYQSYKKPVKKDSQILPPTLPYVFGEGDATNGTQINFETWSALPDERKNTVKIILKKGDNTVLEHTFFGSEINNQGINLFYEGASDDDRQIIESYGGIAATPASLVSIKPYLETGRGRFNSEINLYIGDQVLLRTEYSIKNNVFIFDDEMFSVAGNNLGMYFTLSRIQDNHNLDTNSKILMAGNTAIAREYLKHIVEKGDIISRSLDHQYNIGYSRATITQNRVLSAVDGVPTTFDFKGLSIDASIYINDYSGRGNHKDHWKDFRLLWGLESSYYEAQLFADVVGLDGISTVKGLQYAYGRPSEYTVHTITAENESAIDTLDISGNTKANMHVDVQAGNTVITPDKSITDGAWMGQLYVSLEPNWLGTYAIGEQVGMNGGWTTATFDSEEVGTFKNEGTIDNFIYSDSDANSKGKICRISRTNFLDIMDNEEWLPEYGLPCMIENLSFGDNDHKLILTIDAAKFVSSHNNYSVWKRENDVVAKLRQKFSNNADLANKNVYIYWGTYSFANGDPNWSNQDKIDKLAVYNPITDQAYVISEKDMAQKYISSGKIVNQHVPNLLGFPSGDVISAATSFSGSEGQYQNFVNGQIYFKDNTWPLSNQTFVVFGEIAEYYNSDQNVRNWNRGSGGLLGFPVGDPMFPYKNNVSIIQQSFEKDNIQYNKANQNVNFFIKITEDRRKLNKQYAERLLKDKVETGNLTDVEAFARIVNFVADVTHSNDEFVSDLGVLFVGTEKVISYAYFKQGKYDQVNPLMINGFSDTGFKFYYNDSHYCIRNDGLSNQLYHSVGGFNIGYYWNGPAVDLINFFHEQLEFFRLKPSPLGLGGSSIEDSRLTEVMGELGIILKNNQKNKSEIGSWILDQLAVQDSVVTFRKERKVLKDECDIRRHFRRFEEDLIRPVFSATKWYYDRDMQYENNSWVQFYEWFDNKNNMKAVWNQSRQEVELQPQ
ncbi:MAG: transglutaminase domain-containing protein [bacterium]|nr:transglutaminase domain-containing protein [bacterium]